MIISANTIFYGDAMGSVHFLRLENEKPIHRVPSETNHAARPTSGRCIADELIASFDTAISQSAPTRRNAFSGFAQKVRPR